MAILVLGGAGYIGSHMVDRLVEAARKVTGHPIPLEIAGRRPGDPDTLIASSDKARQVLGWQDFQTCLGRCRCLQANKRRSNRLHAFY